MELVRDGEDGELDLEDPQLEEKLVNELKAQGIFDQFRKDCLSDVDTKPAYQNLRVRVDKSVSSYLSKTTWRPTLNKNQLRNQLRKYIQEMGGVEAGVDRIVDQIVNPKLNTSFMPEVENVIYKYFGTSKPEEGDDMVNGNNVDENDVSQNLQNGETDHDMGGKISTRNLSTISSDAELLNFDANSMGSSPGPGLAGNVSPLTPGGSPKVNQGDISPLTPSHTPPPAQNVQPQCMELSQALENLPSETPAPMQVETPPPPGEELKIEDVVMEVDTEEMSRPQSAYTPPLPPANDTKHSTPEKSYTPPIHVMITPGPSVVKTSNPPSPHTPPLPPLPRQIGGEDSGGEASMSSISDTDLGETISPPQQRKQSSVCEKKGGDSASDISEEELRLDSEAGAMTKERNSDNVSPDKDTGSDYEDLQQLERMKAELMAQLEGDFKLSPEESDSEGELADEGEAAAKDSPTSPDHSVSSRSETPVAKQAASSSSSNSSPNQLQKLRSLPFPSPDYSSMTSVERIKTLPLPGEHASDKGKTNSGQGSPEEFGKTLSPNLPSTGPKTPPIPPMPMSRSPSLSPSPPPPRRGPKTPPSPSVSDQPTLHASPPQESLSKLQLSDSPSVTPTCKPFTSEGSRSPKSDGDFGGGSGESAPPSHGPVSGNASSTQDGSRGFKVAGESKDQKTQEKTSHNSKSHNSSRHHHHSSSRDKKVDKKMEKIKEQTKAKIEKYEQKIKSKDKLKSDKFQDMDIFSTTKKPATPYQPHRTPKAGTSGSNTPVNSKPQKDFEIKLAESIKKEVERREEEKEKRSKEEEEKRRKEEKIEEEKKRKEEERREEEKKRKDELRKEEEKKRKDELRKEEEKKRKENESKGFKLPVKIEDRRRSSSSEKIKERRSSKDEKRDSSKSKERDKYEKDRKDRKSSDKERRSSEDEKKESKERDSKYEKERERQALESKQRLKEAREKKEKEEKEKKRQKEKEKREKEKRNKDEKDRPVKKGGTKSETNDIIKEKIGNLGIDNLQKMLMESLAEKIGAKISEEEKKEMIKKVEDLIKQKKDAKKSPKKRLESDSSEEERPVKKVSPAKKNAIPDSSDSNPSDSNVDSESDSKIKDIKNRISERRKSVESDKPREQSPKRPARPVRNKITKRLKVENEHSDADFPIKGGILEKAPPVPKGPFKSAETAVKSEIPVKVESPIKVETKSKVEVKAKSITEVKSRPVKKVNPKSKKVVKKVDLDPEMSDLSAFTQDDVDFMLSIKEKYDSLLQNEDNLSVSSITSEELNAAIPATRTVVIDAGPNPEETVEILKKFGGNPKLFTPVPEWLHPYLRGAKVKLEDVGMPTKEEISDYIQKKQTKAKKRGAGFDIVVEWVPTGPPPAKKSKLEKQLGFDVDSSFGQNVALSGGKRTRRANMKYSDKDFTSEDDSNSRTSVQPSSDLSTASDVMDADQAAPPNPNVIQPSNTVRTHVGSAQTPKRYGKGKKGKLDLSRVDAESMDIDDGMTDEDNIAIKKDSPDSPAAAEDRAEGKGLEEENPNSMISEESSPGKKRRSKDIIAAYLTSAGVERVDQAAVETKAVVSESVEKPADSSDDDDGVIGVASSSDEDKVSVVAMLDAEISAADEELNSLLKNLKKRKRSSSGNSKFHGWPAPSITPKTAFSAMLEAAAGELTQIESAGASFGMTDLDLLLSSDDEEGLLEVVLSLPMQRDIKKVENIEWPSGAKPRTSPAGSKEEGSKIKQTDSDSDERGALSPSSFGSTKENVPEIYNSIPTKCSQKVSGGGKKRKSLQNPVLKTSLEVS